MFLSSKRDREREREYIYILLSPSLRQVNHSMRAGKYGGAARRKHKSTNRESKEQVSMKWREEGWKGENN